MNVRSSNPFFIELISSDIFTEQQKDFIKATYLKHKKNSDRKIIISMRHSAKVGRPTKIKNKISFNIMLNYYKRGLVGWRTISKIFGIAKQTFYGYVNKIYDEKENISVNLDDEKMKIIEELYNKYCFEYAENWTNRLLSTKYREDMYQECLTELWVGIINYYSLEQDEIISFKAYCNNICESVLNKYIEMATNEKKNLSFDAYAYDDSDKNGLYFILNNKE